jgi:predicted amidophosphoribosyltransferase
MSLAASLFVPPRCGLCGAPGDPGVGACARCRRDLARLRPVAGRPPAGLDGVWSAAPYRGAAQALVRGLKFGRMLALARVAAQALAQAPPDLLAGAVVPVPAAPLRGLWRGFDPAEEIACELVRIAGLAYAPCLRRSQGPRQVGRVRSERLCTPPRVRARRAPPHSAVLVDDVLTTGATLVSCAAALREAGCTRVAAVTFARSARSLGGTA